MMAGAAASFRDPDAGELLAAYATQRRAQRESKRLLDNAGARRLDLLRQAEQLEPPRQYSSEKMD